MRAPLDSTRACAAAATDLQLFASQLRSSQPLLQHTQFCGVHLSLAALALLCLSGTRLKCPNSRLLIAQGGIQFLDGAPRQLLHLLPLRSRVLALHLHNASRTALSQASVQLLALQRGS